MATAAQTRRVPPAPALVLVAIASVQCGSAIARTLFDDVGPGGTVALRIVFAALALAVLWRPRVRGHTREEMAIVALFGVTLAAMNLSFYEAIDRIPLGIAVTIEFCGPLAVAVFGSRRALDLLWVAMAAAGILLLARGGGGVHVAGVLFALLAATFWAAYILLSVRAPTRAATCSRPACCSQASGWRCCRPRSRTRSSSRHCAGCPRASSGS
jgi:inner membrane transporter RhtA